jgi:hypothetical protein
MSATRPPPISRNDAACERHHEGEDQVWNTEGRIVEVKDLACTELVREQSVTQEREHLRREGKPGKQVRGLVKAAYRCA